MEKIEISYFQNEKEKLQAERKARKKSVIVNAGLLKAGKSTLFNALAGKEVFASDVVRATRENSKIELEEYFLMDTPGLDAQDEDTQMALMGYEEADCIIFVHNIQEGELNQVEIDSIRQISNLFGDDNIFFESAILVLTHKDQIDNQYEDIKKRIDEQCESIFKNHFRKSFCVDSNGYRKGVAENKELLKQESGIPELLEMIKSESGNLQESSLQKAQFEKKKEKFLLKINEAILNLKATMPKKEEKSSDDIEKVKSKIIQLSEKAVKEIKDKKITLSVPNSSSYSWRAQERDWKDYKSEYSAKTAGKEAIANGIRKISKAARDDALNIVERAEDYINLAETPNDMVNGLLDTYEKIRHCALGAGVTIRTNFNVALHDASEIENARREIGYIKREARDISTGNFSAGSYYVSIDSNRRFEWVEIAFGMGINKWVTLYQYDIGIAIRGISNDAVDIIIKIRDKAYDAVSSVFGGIKYDLEHQFRNLTEKILAEISSEIEILKKKEQKYLEQRNMIQKKIEELESCRRDVEDNYDDEEKKYEDNNSNPISYISSAICSLMILYLLSKW